MPSYSPRVSYYYVLFGGWSVFTCLGHGMDACLWEVCLFYLCIRVFPCLRVGNVVSEVPQHLLFLLSASLLSRLLFCYLVFLPLLSYAHAVLKLPVLHQFFVSSAFKKSLSLRHRQCVFILSLLIWWLVYFV